MQRTKTVTMCCAFLLGGMGLTARVARACEDELLPTAELVMAKAIAAREPIDTEGALVAGETVYAWTNLREAEGAAVEHVWTRNGREVARHAMDIGGPRWRTWSRHRLTEGHYEVMVVVDGAVVAAQTIDVPAPPVARR